MALLSDLAAICAAHRLDSEPTLNQFARELREAARVSKAGRGRGAARMTFLDGARFLIACAATDHPKRAADAEEVFSNTLFEYGTRRPGQSMSVPIENAEPTLDRALAKVLESIADGSLEERDSRFPDGELRYISLPLELTIFRSGVMANLRAGADEMFYGHPAKLQMTAAPNADVMHALSIAWERETERFRSGKNLQATLRSPLLRDVANAIAGNPVIAERQTTVTEPGASAPGQNEDDGK